MSWSDVLPGENLLPTPVYVSPGDRIDRYQMIARLHGHGWTTGIGQDERGVFMLVEGYAPQSRVTVTLPPMERDDHSKALSDAYYVIGNHLTKIGQGGHA